jgi:hypothetical protein
LFWAAGGEADFGSPRPEAQVPAESTDEPSHVRSQPTKPSTPASVLAEPQGDYREDVAAVLMTLADMAYEPEAAMEQAARSLGVAPIYRVESAGMRVDIGSVEGADPPVYTVAFRGTALDGDDRERMLNIITDLRALVPVALAGTSYPGRVHRGFNDGLSKLWDAGLSTELAERLVGARVWLTGHSLGGAMATLAAPRIETLAYDPDAIAGVYVFGSPRVGNARFREAYDGAFGQRTFRVTYGSDVVTHMAPALSYEQSILRLSGLSGLFGLVSDQFAQYEHVGRFCWYRRDQRLSGGACQPPGSEAGELAAEWQRDLEDVLESQGHVGALMTLAREHSAYATFLIPSS